MLQQVSKKLAYLGTPIRVFAEDPTEIIEPFFALPDINRAVEMDFHPHCAAFTTEDVKQVSQDGRVMNVLSHEAVGAIMLRTTRPEARGFRRWMYQTAMPNLGTSRGTARKMAILREAATTLSTIHTATLSVEERAALVKQVTRLLTEEEGLDIGSPASFKTLMLPHDRRSDVKKPKKTKR